MLVRLVTLAVLGVAAPLGAQATRQYASGGEVVSRLATRIPGVSHEQKARVRVGGDSAQRIALHDFAWKGRVVSVEIDEQDARLFWDVKVEPDSNPRAIIRYRVDATNGGILGIREFAVAPRRRP
jgi:uncharacterized membrane protein YkoI